jgi:hypothetical protein
MVVLLCVGVARPDHVADVILVPDEQRHGVASVRLAGGIVIHRPVFKSN